MRIIRECGVIVFNWIRGCHVEVRSMTNKKWETPKVGLGRRPEVTRGNKSEAPPHPKAARTEEHNALRSAWEGRAV